MPRANGDERDSEFGYGRTQPEFSLGERMATMEATLKSLVESVGAAQTAQSVLFVEKISSVRQEMSTKDTAQKEATTKAEKSAADTASALATELKSSRETTDARLGAIERGGAGVGGEKIGESSTTAAGYATRAERKAVVALAITGIVGAFVMIGVIVALVVALQ
jgi:hypothetical protein